MLVDTQYKNNKIKRTTILERIAKDDKSAVRDCLSRYGNLVWRLARETAISGTEAEILAREIFADICRCADKFDPAKFSEVDFIKLLVRHRLLKFSKNIN